ncbi:MAG: hypothetical protein K6T83_09020 [Alicyclobacillus sp.]|nr:hypothetical protein [Alicyclobacillus sp.]
MMKQEMSLDSGDSILEFSVARDSDWLLFSFDFSRRNTWAELRLIDPHGMLRFAYMDVHAPRQAILHRQPDLTCYTGIPGSVRAGIWIIQLLRFKTSEVLSFEV